MNCISEKAISDLAKSKPLPRSANDERQRTEETLRDIAFVLAMTRRVKSEIGKDESPSA